MTSRHVLGRMMTASYQRTWPFAPPGIRIRFIPAHRYQQPWSAKYDYARRLVLVNTDTPSDAIDGAVAHELGHARWTAPLPDLPGEEGSTALILAALDEVRVQAWVIRAHPPALAQLRAAAVRDLPEALTATNLRGVLLAHIYVYGQVLAGVFTEDELADFHARIVAILGVRATHDLDRQVSRAFVVAPGDYSELTKLARVIDRSARERP
jgi:hypothetical protein